MAPQPRILRVYVLDAADLSREDKPSEKPDSYLVIKMGNTVVKDDVRSLRKDEFNPEYFVNYEFPIEIPGCPYLRIEIWNKNEILKDTMIGYTEIDLEERHFNKQWLDLEKKPIEYRTLKRESDNAPCGRVGCWIELIEPEHRIPRYEISPLEKLECELRVIIWEATDFVFREKVYTLFILNNMFSPLKLQIFLLEED
mgnify:FL=1